MPSPAPLGRASARLYCMAAHARARERRDHDAQPSGASARESVWHTSECLGITVCVRRGAVAAVAPRADCLHDPPSPWRRRGGPVTVILIGVPPRDILAWRVRVSECGGTQRVASLRARVPPKMKMNINRSRSVPPRARLSKFYRALARTVEAPRVAGPGLVVHGRAPHGLASRGPRPAGCGRVFFFAVKYTAQESGRSPRCTLPGLRLRPPPPPGAPPPCPMPKSTPLASPRGRAEPEPTGWEHTADGYDPHLVTRALRARGSSRSTLL